MAVFFIQPSRFTAAANPSLISAITDAGLTSNLKLCLDAGDGDSYTSGQSWLDLSGGGYDFFLGATSGSEASDPAFNGTADALTSAEYFSNDAGDVFTYDTTNETWMQNIHKNNAIFSAMAAIYLDTTPAASRQLIGTNTASGTNAGFHWRINTTPAQAFVVGNGSGTVKSVAASTLAEDAWYIIGVSLDESVGTGGGFFYVNGAYDQSGGSDTWSSTYSSPTASNAASTMSLFRLLESANRIGWLAAWEGTAITKANMDTLYAALKGRYGLS